MGELYLNRAYINTVVFKRQPCSPEVKKEKIKDGEIFPTCSKVCPMGSTKSILRPFA
jgi:hypothetical protein